MLLIIYLGEVSFRCLARQSYYHDCFSLHYRLFCNKSLIDQIKTAFKNVKRGDGISLHEAREIGLIIDDYRSIDSSESEVLLALARTRDVDTCWQEIPSSCLEKFCDYSSGIWYYYLDSQGWRYYLPAFMVQSIRQYLDYDVIYDLDYFIDRLFPPKKHEVLDRTNRVFRIISRSEYITSITAEQLTAIYLVLGFIIDYVKEDYTQARAKEAMKQWQKVNQQIDSQCSASLVKINCENWDN